MLGKGQLSLGFLGMETHAPISAAFPMGLCNPLLTELGSIATTLS